MDGPFKQNFVVDAAKKLQKEHNLDDLGGLTLPISDSEIGTGLVNQALLVQSPRSKILNDS